MRLREIPGPVGPLEVLLEEPPAERGVNAEGLVERGQADGLRAAVVVAHPHPQRGGTAVVSRQPGCFLVASVFVKRGVAA